MDSNWNNCDFNRNYTIFNPADKLFNLKTSIKRNKRKKINLA